jgi:ABC-2 type transport system ATP-binding protein
MDHGKILAEGTLDDLKRQVGGEELVTVRGGFDAATARARVERLEGASILSAEPGKLVVSMRESGRGAVETLTAILSGGLPIEDVSIQPPSLNSLFLRLTGRELRD